MKRRLFLKMFGGVAAAPAVVKPVIPIAPMSIAPLTGALMAEGISPDLTTENDGGIFGSSPEATAIKRVKRLGTLRRLILGVEEPEEEGWTINRRKRAHMEVHINSLRSISHGGKLRMLDKQIYDLERETNRVDWFREYRRLKKGED